MPEQQLEEKNYPIQWKWILIGAAVGVILLALLVPIVNATFVNKTVPLLMGTVVFLLTGIIVGYKSPGVTIREAALAGLIAILLADVLMFWIFDIPLSPLHGITFVVIAYLLALLGGWVGEVIQGTKGAAPSKHGIQWQWIAVGLAIGFILNYFSVFLLFIFFRFGEVGIVLSFALSFLIMGLIVGYKSPGVTILESALAGIGLIILEYFLITIGLGGGAFPAQYLMIGLAGSFVLGLLGGWLGELMQETAGTKG